jgi:hypothetical protein
MTSIIHFEDFPKTAMQITNPEYFFYNLQGKGERRHEGDMTAIIVSWLEILVIIIAIIFLWRIIT